MRTNSDEQEKSSLVKHKTALQEHLGQITQTQLIAQPPEDDLQHDIGGLFQIVEGCTGAFIEDASAR